MVGPSLNTHNLTLKPNAAAVSTTTIKFLCSYGGKILPRYPDGKLRYHGGETRVLAVDRTISFAELLVKMTELCGTSVSLRCQLPTEDLDALVSITSDEDLANLIEEYDRPASPISSLKIRAFLSPPKSTKKVSPPPSTAASSNSPPDATSSPRSVYFICSSSRFPDRHLHQTAKPVVYPLCYEKSSASAAAAAAAAAAKVPHYAYHAHLRNPSHIYFVHNGNHWQ